MLRYFNLKQKEEVRKELGEAAVDFSKFLNTVPFFLQSYKKNLINS